MPDPWILAFSVVTVAVTIWMGFRSARTSKSASDFFVAGRSVSVGWNASAISGEYLSAASFMGVAGMVMSAGYDALWYPVCYACGYLFLLLFIAGPLRRFGAYTIPDFAEGRYDSPVFRKIAVIFVLFIGFFYTMPQMKGAGTTLAYVFKDIEFAGHKGLPYWVGVVVVGAVITLNVALGGMKGITLVQAFQYWIKMFAISVPIFVLASVYGWYGSQLGANQSKSLRSTDPAGVNASAETRPTSTRAEQLLTAVQSTTPVGFIFQMNSQGRTDYEREADGPRLVLFNNSRTDFGSRAFGRALTNADLAELARAATGNEGYGFGAQVPVIHYGAALHLLGELQGWRIASLEPQPELQFPIAGLGTRKTLAAGLLTQLATHEITLAHLGGSDYLAYPRSAAGDYRPVLDHFSRTRGLAGVERLPLPAKAPPDSTWLNPFGPLTTRAARAATPVLAAVPAIEMGWSTFSGSLYPRDLEDRLNRILQRPNKNWMIEDFSTATTNLLVHYARFVANNSPIAHGAAFQLSTSPNLPPLVPEFEWRGLHVHEVIEQLERAFLTNGITVLRQQGNHFIAFPTREATINPVNPRPYALLYTYSLIIALVCGTAGLPHILVRFYTNPDGVAAKRTTMWVMILIGVFYVFPPMFGVMGRNLMPSLYEGAGVNGTDGIVLKLPTVLGERLGPLGSILSGITCAGAFAAFMSTFSGLLVSMTGAMAHDVYGRILKPGSTPAQRLRMFKVAAVGIGAVAIGLGTLVENFEINFMVGQAFAIAAASYFPLLFMSVWWRGMTTHGAATGMLTGGLLAVAAISLTSWTTFVTAQAAKFQALGRVEPGWFSALRDHSLVDFWAAHPLLRILCEQPAIWAVPLAILLMIVVSLRTRHAVPDDVREKMLVLHAPEALGLRQDYIRDHEH